MLELAKRDLTASSGENAAPVAIREIVARHAIPQPFLVQILSQLKLAGLVTSTRGSAGGYRLAVAASSLTLLDICEAVGIQDGCDLQDPAACTAEVHVLEQCFQAASEAARGVLADTSLFELATRCADDNTAMFYI